MTVTSDLISSISPYSVGAAGDVTSAQLSTLITLAEKKIAMEKPSDLNSDAEDYLTALIVCDFIERKLGKSGLASESIGDYSYSKARGDKSSYIMEYESELEQYSIEQPSTGIKRADAPDRTMMKNYKLDQNDIDTITDDGGLGE
jgi:hypothetical protein